jgi:hypothetical protein
VVCPNPYKSVGQGNVGLVTKFGKFYKAVDPGLVKVNPLSERLIQVDVKIQIVEVPKQICMTKDNVNLHLTSVIYYHIVSPHKAAFGISNVRQALIERTQTTLRHVVGARVLQDVIERREEIAQNIAEIIEDVAAGWGVAVESMLIKDMVFSQELQESLSMAAQSKRIGESKIIAAKAEVRSIRCVLILMPGQAIANKQIRSSPRNSCVKRPTFFLRHQPCRSATSRRCKRWPRAPTARLSSYPQRTRLWVPALSALPWRTLSTTRARAATRTTSVTLEVRTRASNQQ